MVDRFSNTSFRNRSLSSLLKTLMRTNDFSSSSSYAFYDNVLAFFRRLSLWASSIPKPDHLSIDWLSSLHICVGKNSSFYWKTVVCFLYAMVLFELPCTGVPVGIINPVESNNIFQNLLTAVSVSDNVAIWASKVFPITSLRRTSNITWSATL